MITNLQIKNFKSIESLDINCGRINLFVGEPNTGKSNILESIGIMSFPYVTNLNQIVRYEKSLNLFHKGLANNEIEVTSDEYIFRLKKKNNQFEGYFGERDLKSDKISYDIKSRIYLGLDRDSTTVDYGTLNWSSPIKFYKFIPSNKFENQSIDFLVPPFGTNLFTILYSRPDIHEFASSLFRNYGYKILLRSETNEIEILIEDPKLIGLPYTMASDTLQRIVFYYAVLETNKSDVIVLEEPEAHVFPFFNKFIAERIALYNNNQFFLATHNPTFLSNFIEQTDENELKVFVTYYEDYKTKVLELSGDRLRKIYKIYGSEIFANLYKIVNGFEKILSQDSEN